MSSILIIGGYGDVGKYVSESLLSQTNYAIIIAGRNEERATEILQRYSLQQVKFMLIDIYDNLTYHQKLNDIALVVMCLSPKSIDFGLYCLEQGIHYIDISPSNQISEQLQQSYRKSKKKLAVCILGVGICPGLSTLLATTISKNFNKIESISTSLLLGMGDEYGDDALDWLLSNLKKDFIWNQKGNSISHKPFIKSKPAYFDSLGKHCAYAFNLSDQQIITKTLHQNYVSTYFCYDKKFTTWLVHFLSKIKVFRLLKYPLFYKLAKKVIQTSIKMSKKFSSDVFAINVEVVGYQNKKLVTVIQTIEGINSARTTGAVIAETILKLHHSKIHTGIFYLHELCGLSDFDQIVDLHYGYSKTY